MRALRYTFLTVPMARLAVVVLSPRGLPRGRRGERPDICQDLRRQGSAHLPNLAAIRTVAGRTRTETWRLGRSTGR